MSKPGLIVVNSSRSWGGNEHWAVRTARGLAERGHPVRFIWSHEVIGERVRRLGLDNCRVHQGGDLDPRGILALRQEMVRCQPRAVLLTRWREYLQGGLAARMAGRPRVVLRLGLKMTPQDDLKRRLIFGLADRIIVNAPEIREGLARVPWLDSEKIELVINGTDLPEWHPPWTPEGEKRRASFRAAVGLSQKDLLAVNVGNLTGQKDQATLLEATRLVKEKIPGVKLHIIGTGPLQEDLTARATELGLKDTVFFPGFVSDLTDVLAAADLFVLSSRNEGMSRALIEAAASGLPAVATDVSGSRHCVLEAESGRVVPVGAPQELAGAMAEILLDADLRRTMGRRARKLANERFDAVRMVDETAAVLFD